MVSKKRLVDCARIIINCMNLEKGNCVYIRGNAHFREIIEQVALEALRNGIHPLVSTVSDQYYQSLFEDEKINPETLQQTPKHLLKLTESIDARITFDFYSDPSIRSRAPRKKTNALIRAFSPLNAIVRGSNEKFPKGKKWLYVGWPSKKAAEYYGLNYEKLKESIIGGISVPIEYLNELTMTLSKKFKNAKIVRVRDDLGTDFWVDVENRSCERDYGSISLDHVSKGYLGSNLPAGEIAFPPNETKGEGKFFCPITMNVFSQKILKNLCMQ
mgnify:CR=1 FL=1